MPKCKVCRKTYKVINLSHLRTHGIDSLEAYAAWGVAQPEAPLGFDVVKVTPRPPELQEAVKVVPPAEATLVTPAVEPERRWTEARRVVKRWFKWLGSRHQRPLWLSSGFVPSVGDGGFINATHNLMLVIGPPDAAADQALRDRGLYVLRFSEQQVLANEVDTLAQLRAWLREFRLI